MKNHSRNFYQALVLPAALLVFFASAAFGQNAVKVSVDATDAGRNILHVRETVQARAGDFQLFYPKWIPGEHAPDAPLNDVVNLFFTANGKPLEWRRDDVEMFAFHVTVPANVKQIDISFDDVSQPGTIASAQLSRIKWNRLLMYPRGVQSDDIQVTGSLKMANDWKYATALPVARETKNAVDFKAVNLTTFIDSPAVVGRNFKRVPLEDFNGAAHEIDMFADTPEALEFTPETLAGWKNLVKQANTAFGARHYGSYKFLLTLSDVGGSEGLEHHESSEDGVGLKALSDPLEMLDLGDLLGHEYTHSWNGKYRRPATLATSDFEKPQYGELLWVYEGLTQYLGHVFPTRSGLWTPEVYRDVLAYDAANLDAETGRRWRPLVDTARAVQFTYASPAAWRTERRRVDYYDEGALIWLEADVLIRQKSGGKLSLDDFFKRFHGVGGNTLPKVVGYDFDEVARTLNSVVPYDWSGFLRDRVYRVAPRAPTGGITNGGWKTVFNDQPNVQIQMGEHARGSANLMFSIGVLVGKDGTIGDINPDLPAFKAGLAPGMKITKINGEDFSTDNMHKAIDAKKSFEIVAENGGFTETYKLNYSGGERYPHLERDATKPDTLSEILQPLAAQKFAGAPAGFFPTIEPGSFIMPVTTRRRPTRPIAPNVPANVTKVLLSQTEITSNCPTNLNPCSDGKKTIKISTEAVDPENDVLAYIYAVSGGKIVGTGSKVVWDLSDAKPGEYTITVGVDDGCGVCGQTKTATIIVK